MGGDLRTFPYSERIEHGHRHRIAQSTANEFNHISIRGD
jgi:hypothetical protein